MNDGERGELDMEHPANSRVFSGKEKRGAAQKRKRGPLKKTRIRLPDAAPSNTIPKFENPFKTKS